MKRVLYDMSNGLAEEIANSITTEISPDNLFDQLVLNFYKLQSSILNNKIYLTLILLGILLILIGMYISIYKKPFLINRKKLALIKGIKYLKFIELITNRFPLKVLSGKLNSSITYFMLDNIVQRSVVAVLTIMLPMVGILLYCAINSGLQLWYAKFITLSLCIMLPYYIFSLAVDYMKYSIRLKIPLLIDSFRNSFMIHYRIKPALQECSSDNNRILGQIMRRVSDSSDLNYSLCTIRDKIDDTWFNIFVLLIINYRENGGELIAQLYKLNRSITRYNNIEKKKNKRLIWYEVFVIIASIFSLPTIMLINKLLLGIDVGLYYDATAAFTKVVIFSFSALVIVRVLRRM